MKHFLPTTSLLLLSLLAALTFLPVSAQTTIRLWTGSEDTEGDASDAQLLAYLPAQCNGKAVIICPGGAYVGLALDIEGTDFASWFRKQGIAAFVLKYRMPKGRNGIPLKDAEKAMRIVRGNAEKWGINPDNIGIMGSSAGGHLASTLATHYSSDESKPDFQILLYPVITMDKSYTHMGSRVNLLGNSPTADLVRAYSNELQVKSTTPPCFIAVSAKDELVPVKNSLTYTQNLIDKGVPVALHVYPGGYHGFGFRSDFKDHDIFLTDLQDWLDKEIVVKPVISSKALIKHFSGDNCQISCNCAMPLDYRSVNGKDYGTTFENLCDNDHEHTILHSRFDWAASGIVGMDLRTQDEWIQVDLQRNDIRYFNYEFWGIANNSAYDNPNDIVIEATNTPDDDASWKQVAEDKPDAKSVSDYYYLSPTIDMGAAYRYVRFVIKSTVTNAAYWNISEFQMYNSALTSVKDVNASAARAKEAVYSIDGALLGKDKKDVSLSRGIYIIGNKKVEVK